MAHEHMMAGEMHNGQDYAEQLLLLEDDYAATYDTNDTGAEYGPDLLQTTMDDDYANTMFVPSAEYTE
jgi:hypothetical protein